MTFFICACFCVWTWKYFVSKPPVLHIYLVPNVFPISMLLLLVISFYIMLSFGSTQDKLNILDGKLIWTCMAFYNCALLLCSTWVKLLLQLLRSGSRCKSFLFRCLCTIAKRLLLLVIKSPLFLAEVQQSKIFQIHYLKKTHDTKASVTHLVLSSWVV